MNDKNTDFQAMKQGYPNCRVAEVNAQPFRHGSLFSGIGGFDLAAEWMGWENVFHCEWNEFGKKVLNYYWPNAISYDDITKTDFSIHRGNIDILTGGFPCQPYSAAGKRLGKEDERHLWPEMLRAIREIAPRYVVGENVLGIVSWNGGLVFDEVQADLEAEGYEVQPVILPACAVNAPHIRDRVWFVAYASGKRTGNTSREIDNENRRTCEDWGEGIRQTHGKIGTGGINSTNTNVANSSNIGCDNGSDNREERHVQTNFRATEKDQSEWNGRIGRISEIGSITTNTRLQRPKERQELTMGIDQLCEERPFADTITAGKWRNEWKGKSERNLWEQFPTESPICGGNDGLPTELDGITFPKWKTESLKAYGNAIVPQVVYQIFNAISVHEAEYGWR